MSPRAWASSLIASSLFWLSVILLHVWGNSWPLAFFLALCGLVAGVFLSIGIANLVARKEHP